MPNGSSINSLEIRHTPKTIPGGARPGWGLPYQQLPAATRTDLSPESVLQREIQTGKQQIQDKYALQWREVNRSKRFLGATKSQRMLREIDAKARQEMLQFNQQAQQQIAQLQNIDRLTQQGMISNPDEIKARMVFGADVAKSMYPRPERERTVPQQFGELDVYSHRISQELENFQVIGGKKPSKALAALGAVSPLAGVAAAYQAITRMPKKPELQVWDPTIPVRVKDPKTKKMVDVMGKWRKAEPGEIARYAALVQEEKAIAQRKTELLGRPGISRRVIQPDTKGGTFSDKIAGSVRPQRSAAKPRVIRQRNRKTGQERISYDGGRSWQIVSG